MTQIQQPEALNLEEFRAKVTRAAREPLRKRGATAYPTEGATAQTETLLAELAEETEAAENWRRLALQFDNHRLQALGHLKAILHPDSSVDEYKTAELFLKAPPLDGESVLAQRIAKLSAAATQAQEDAPVGFAWSGWACMYPGNAPGHSHKIPGVWDIDNGEPAGKKCSWCELWQEALEIYRQKDQFYN